MDQMTQAKPTDSEQIRRRTLRNRLTIATVLYVVLSPLAAFWGFMTVMASDAGSSPAINLYINVNMALPVVMIAAPVAAWVAYALKRPGWANGLLFVPVVWAIVAFALMFTL